MFFWQYVPLAVQFLCTRVKEPTIQDETKLELKLTKCLDYGN